MIFLDYVIQKPNTFFLQECRKSLLGKQKTDKPKPIGSYAVDGTWTRTQKPGLDP